MIDVVSISCRFVCVRLCGEGRGGCRGVEKCVYLTCVGRVEKSLFANGYCRICEAARIIIIPIINSKTFFFVIAKLVSF